MLQSFLKPGADVKALSAKLRPTKEDLAALYDAELADVLEKAYAPAWEAGQIVIAGTPEGVEAAMGEAKNQGIKRAIPLNVGGAFHTPLMGDASAELTTILASTERIMCWREPVASLGLVGPPNLVARMTWSRLPFSASPMNSSDLPPPYMRAVSKKFTPASMAKGEAAGLDRGQWYFLGRGGVLGDVESAVVTAACAFASA